MEEGEVTAIGSLVKMLGMKLADDLWEASGATHESTVSDVVRGTLARIAELEATIARVRALMGEWPKEWPTVQAYNHEHDGYLGSSMDHAENGEWLQECDVREAIEKALDADQGAGEA